MTALQPRVFPVALDPKLRSVIVTADHIWLPASACGRHRARNIRAGPDHERIAIAPRDGSVAARRPRTVTDLSLGEGVDRKPRQGGPMRQRKPDPKTEKLLAERAHGMRHAPTASEAALFCLLSGKQLGVQFRRQVPLGGRYIADLVAPSVGLIVEVDGASHARRKKADARRDRVLRRLGYRVLRLDAQLVVKSLPPIAYGGRFRPK
jgi:very-short-patch-repair endonuclease